MTSYREMKEELMKLNDLELLSIGVPELKFYYDRGEYLALCPFHNDSRLGSFCYNLSKGCWKCFACGKGGKGPYDLIMAMKGWTYTDTLAYLYKHRGSARPFHAEQAPLSLMSSRCRVVSGSSQFPSTSPAKKMVEKPVPDKRVHSQDELSLIYTCFAKASPLSETETQALCKKRGLYYRSRTAFFRFPSYKDKLFMKRFMAGLDRESEAAGYGKISNGLLGVPGFFWDKEAQEVRFVGFNDSLGILNHDADGRVNGIEMRLPEQASSHMRYMPFSSEGICVRYPEQYTCGTNLGAIVDVEPPAFSDRKYLGIAVTEGKFKALHLSYLGYYTLNIHGVTNWQKIFPVLDRLKEKGVDTGTIHIALDADSRKNLAVGRISLAMGQELQKRGHSVKYITWPLPSGKGIDDVINNGNKHKIRIVEAERFISTTLLPSIKKLEADFVLKKQQNGRIAG